MGSVRGLVRLDLSTSGLESHQDAGYFPLVVVYVIRFNERDEAILIGHTKVVKAKPLVIQLLRFLHSLAPPIFVTQMFACYTSLS